MRIIGGRAKGLFIKGPPGQHTRPTLARVRQSIFDILGAGVVGASFLDLFAGSGSIGLEALSRGAARVLFVEGKPANCALIRANIRRTALVEGATVWCLDVLRALRRLAAQQEQFTIVFADPPYGEGWLARVGEAVAEGRILAEDGRFLAQVAGKEEAVATFGALHLTREYRYGDTKVLVYRWTLGGVSGLGH